MLCTRQWQRWLEIDLQTILPHLIGPQRTSFFPGRHIIKNIVVAQEVIPSMRNNKGTKGQMKIKMDLKKSYDRLSWSFIHETLLEAGIPTDFVQIIMECVTTIQMNLLGNGELINEFRPSKGIRRGSNIGLYFCSFHWETWPRHLSHCEHGKVETNTTVPTLHFSYLSFLCWWHTFFSWGLVWASYHSLLCPWYLL